MSSEIKSGMEDFFDEFKRNEGLEGGHSWVLLTEKPDDYLPQIVDLVDSSSKRTRVLVARDLNEFQGILPELRATQNLMEIGRSQVLVTNEQVLTDAMQGKGGGDLGYYVADTYLIRTGLEINLDSQE